MTSSTPAFDAAGSSSARTSSAEGSSTGAAEPRRWGVGVVLGCLAVTLGAAGLVHAVGEPDGSFGGEAVTEAVAGALGYAVAFGLAWWRPSRSAHPRTVAERTAMVLAVLGALLVPICFWNPMPATFAFASLIMQRWAVGRVGAANALLVRLTRWLSLIVVAAQVVVLAVHVAGSL